jgi:hypothetical protein
MPGKPGTFNLKGLEVYGETGAQITTGLTPSLSSQYEPASTFGPQHLMSVGGVPTTGLAHTNQGDNEYAQLELAVPSVVSKVIIHNRTDCCSDRILNSELLLLNESMTPYAQKAITEVLAKYEFNFTSPTSGSTSAASTPAPEPVAYPTSGAIFAMKGLKIMPAIFQNSYEDRAVGTTKSASAGLRPAYLTNTSALGKQKNFRVHAKGFEAAPTTTETDLVAGRTNLARQSGTRDNNHAHHAVDGNSNTFQQTSSKQTGWWEVDLPGLCVVNKVVITNRKDERNRLRDIVVTVYNGDAVVYDSGVLNARNALNGPTTLEAKPAAPVTGTRVRVTRNPDRVSDVEGYVLNMANVSVMGVPAPCSANPTAVACKVQSSINDMLFDTSYGRSSDFFENIDRFMTTYIRWNEVLSGSADDRNMRPIAAARAAKAKSMWDAWKARYNDPDTLIFVPDHLLEELRVANGYLMNVHSLVVLQNKKPTGGDGDRAGQWLGREIGSDPNEPVQRLLNQVVFTTFSTANASVAQTAEEFARSVLYEHTFGCARRKPHYWYLNEKGKAGDVPQFKEIEPGDRQICTTPQTSPDMTDYEAMTYITTFMDVEVLQENDRAKNIALAKKHWREVGRASGLVKNNFFFKSSANTVNKVGTDRTFTVPGVLPIRDILKTSDMTSTILLTFYENMRDAIRVRLNTIFNWIRASVEFAGNVYNKVTMTTDEGNGVKENFRKAMVLLYGMSVDIKDIATLPAEIKAKKAPAIPDPIEINGIVANRIFLNGQWYAFSLNALAPFGYLDTRTSRMIYVCGSTNASSASCKSSDDVQCDFVTTGLPTNINSSACDPNTIYGHYMILYVFSKSVGEEFARQQDVFKKQMTNKAAKSVRCYDKRAESSNKKGLDCKSDGYGMCDRYTKPATSGCRSGYWRKNKDITCRAEYRKGSCKGKTKITSSINDWVARLAAPITLPALVDDVFYDEAAEALTGTDETPGADAAYDNDNTY